MKRTNKKLTWKQHIEFAAKLYSMRNDLVHFAVTVGNANLRRHREKCKFDERDHRAFKALGQAYQQIDEARSLLENDLARNFPERFNLNIYYPSKKGKE